MLESLFIGLKLFHEVKKAEELGVAKGRSEIGHMWVLSSKSKTLQQKYIHEKEWYPTNQQRTFLHYAADDADKSKQTFLYDELEERLGNIENSLGKSRAVPEYKTTFSTL